MNTTYHMRIAIPLSLIVVAVLVSPHVIRLVDAQHVLYLETRTPKRVQVKFKQLGASDVVHEIHRRHADTTVLHLWNSWHQKGTLFFDTLLAYTRPGASVCVLNVCTDMPGLRQVRASAMIAEKCGVRGISYILRSKASIFDLHNSKSVHEWLQALIGQSAHAESPSLVFLNRNGECIGIKSAPN